MSTDLITEIQAQPRAFADKLETMRSALEAVTAQLAAVTAERNTFKSACLQMDARDQKRAAAARKVAQWARTSEKDAAARYDSCQSDFMRAISQRDAARAEVARMREVIERKAGALSVFAQHTGLSTGMCLQWRDEFLIALRGDTAPAGQE